MTEAAADERSRDVLVELLKGTIQDARDLVPNYIRGFTVYTLIVGGLLKFAFDANATPILRELLASFGVLVSVVGVLVCVYGEMTRRVLRSDAVSLCMRLGVDPPRSFAEPLRYLVIISMTFDVLVMLGWFYVLVRF